MEVVPLIHVGGGHRGKPFGVGCARIGCLVIALHHLA